jgi:hypothetical protein
MFTNQRGQFYLLKEPINDCPCQYLETTTLRQQRSVLDPSQGTRGLLVAQPTRANALVPYARSPLVTAHS